MHLLLAALFSMAQVLSYPFPAALVAGGDGHSLAYVLNESGVRNVWVAQPPSYAPHQVTHYTQDDGQEISDLSVSKDGKYVVFVRGGDHDSNWPEALQPDPDSSAVQPQMQVFAVPAVGGDPKALGDGDAPAISPDGETVAYVQDHQIWSAPIDGSKAASRLFFDRGEDRDIQWSPDGKAIAFVSNRGDHAFIGVYRDRATPIEYLTPSTDRDFSPQWSPDGTRIAFVRVHGAGGAPEDPLKQYAQPWSIWVASAADGRGERVWRSGNTLRDSLPEINGPQLHWLAGNRLMFVSEHTNWPNLYTVAAAGANQTARPLTPGHFMIEDTSVSPDLQTVYYTANTGKTPGDDDRRHIFRVSASGGAPQEVTSGASSQWWPAATASGLAYVEAGAKSPPLVVHSGRTLDADRVPKDFPAAALVVPKEVHFKAADGVTVEGQLFDAPGGRSKKSAIVFVHGGPPRQMLLNWSYMDYYSNAYAVNQYLANRGYVVLSVNYRLGIGYGHDFHNPDHAGPAGAAEYKDVLAGARFLQHDPHVDAKHIGIWGGSYGGYLTALALARNSDVFKGGVDFHGVHDWTLFPEWYGGSGPQRYQQPDMKRFLKVAWESSPDASIAMWKSPVLLIQGDDDRNVRFHQMVDLVDRLRAAHVPYEELVIPNEIHGFLRWHSWLEADQATADWFARHFPH